MLTDDPGGFFCESLGEFLRFCLFMNFEGATRIADTHFVPWLSILDLDLDMIPNKHVGRTLFFLPLKSQKKNSFPMVPEFQNAAHSTTELGPNTDILQRSVCSSRQVVAEISSL